MQKPTCNEPVSSTEGNPGGTVYLTIRIYYLTIRIYPPVNIQKAIENGHVYLIFPFKMVIFRSYVSLPEGKGFQTFGFVFRVFIQYIYIYTYVFLHWKC